MTNTDAVVKRAAEKGLVVPGFNAPYLPMVEPIVRAIVDQDCFALVETARPEWIKFEAHSAAAVMAEYQKWAKPGYTGIHLDHVPVIDEDLQRVDFVEVISEALELGYGSVMVDGSRLSLADNIKATRQIVDLAQKKGVPVEAELGAVMGHEAGPMPPYEELFASGKGFTDVEEARRFARESGCSWLSVAAGNIHGAISAATRDQRKVEARLNLEQLAKLRQAAGVPLVLHGGSGVNRDNVLAAIKKGIAKVNIGTEIRQAYEEAWRATGSVAKAQDACYDRTCWVLRDYFGIAGDRAQLVG
jgi:fructose-bisphosphate aldolase class II